MYQAVTPKHLRESEDFITILENFFGLNYKPRRLLEPEPLKVRLEKWAKENKMIVIGTSCTLIVLCAAYTMPNQGMAVITKTVENEFVITFNQLQSDFLTLPELTAGLYMTEESSMLEPFILEENSLEEVSKIKSIPAQIAEEVTSELLDEETLEQIRILEEQQREAARVREEKTYIQLYCDIFGLDYEKVYQILSDVTNDFKDEAYLNDFIIGDSTLKKRTVTCTSKEMAILIAVRNIYWSPERYGYTGNDLRTGVEYQCDLDYSKQIAYIANVLDLDPALNYAICKLESNFHSPLFINKHNPAGLRFTSSFTAFPSATAGFIEQALEILKYQIDGRTTIAAIGEKYAPTSDPSNSGWVSGVTSIYNTASKNYEELFGGDITFLMEEPMALELVYYNDLESTLEEKITETVPEINTEERSYIKTYANIYGLKEDIVYQIISDLTNGFQEEAYQSENIIGTSEVNGKRIICSSKEMAILLAVRNIYQNPEAFGYKASDLKAELPYQTDVSFADQIFYVSNVLGVDPALNYAICQADSGFNSPMFLIKNNPSNLKWNGTFATFPSPMAGFIEEGIELLSYQTDGLAGIASMKERIKPSNPMWVSNVTFIYNYVMEHYDTIFTQLQNPTLTDAKIYVYE